MLKVWKGSETSHHLGDDCQNFLQHLGTISGLLAVSNASAATIPTGAMEKYLPGQFVPMVVNYYFIDTLHVSLQALDHWRAAKSSKTDFTSRAL